jgi:hypothetical protein
MRLICLLICLTVFAAETVLAEENKEWVVIVNKNSVKTEFTRLELYKLFACNSASYNVVFLNVTEDNKNKELYEAFLKTVLDEADINFIKFKSKNLTRIRKREPIVIKFYDTEEAILKHVKEDEKGIAVIPKTLLNDEVKVCVIK